jgi:hypothetical protein
MSKQKRNRKKGGSNNKKRPNPIPENLQRHFFSQLVPKYIEDGDLTVKLEDVKDCIRGRRYARASKLIRDIGYDPRRSENAMHTGFEAGVWRLAMNIIKDNCKNREEFISSLMRNSNVPIETSLSIMSKGGVQYLWDSLGTFPNEFNSTMITLHDKLPFLDEHVLAQYAIDCAKKNAQSVDETFEIAIRQGQTYFNQGAYVLAKKCFDALFPKKVKNSLRNGIQLWKQVLIRGEPSTENESIASAKIMGLQLNLVALYSSFGEKDRVREIVDDTQTITMDGESLLFVGSKSVARLCDNLENIVIANQGRNRNLVFSLGDYIYKAGSYQDLNNETWITQYFRALRSGKIMLEGHTAGHQNINLDGKTATHDIAAAQSINIAETYHLMWRQSMPPQIRERFNQECIVCYGTLPGSMIRDIMSGEDPESAGEAYLTAVSTLGVIHALGPKHLLEEVPFVHKPRAKDYQEHIVRCMRRGNGFTRADIDIARKAYSPIAQSLEKRKIDSYVKDANPFNWIAYQDDPRTICAIDFETCQIAGPQYDLVKIIEHFDHLTSENKKQLIDAYVAIYNDVAKEFNAVVPEICHKPYIDDHSEFMTTYVYYALDYYIKSYHNGNYESAEFLPQKFHWMNMGISSIDWLQEKHSFNDSDTAKLAALKNVFEKYRDQTERLL